MKLAAIFIRADGVLVDTEELRRLACNRVFAEAGYDSALDPEQFGQRPGFGLSKDSVHDFLRTNIRLRAGVLEIDHLASIMQRRIVALWRHQLVECVNAPRPGVTELISACRDRGIQVAVIGDMPGDMLKRMTQAALGNADTVRVVSGPESGSFPPKQGENRALGAALAELDLDPSAVVALECCPQRLAAATAATLAAVVVRTRHAPHHGLTGAHRVVEDVTDLAGRASGEATAVAAAGVGAAMLEALKLLHSDKKNLRRNFERSHNMRVCDILKIKGTAVKTIGSSEAVQTLTRRLNEDKVGAMVVTGPQGDIEGIVSERDVVRGLAVRGCELLDMPVSTLMTRVVITCAADDSLQGIAKVMTQRRIRHLPVTQDGKLAGLVSIGDVLNWRIEEAQLEANVLRDYTIALR